MITRPTTLVLGAGASAPFGFPMGFQLYTQVCNELNAPPNDLWRLLAECGFSDDQISKFGRALLYSGCTSIDSFLEGRSDEPIFLEIGKTAIAAKLQPFERDANFFSLTPPRVTQEAIWYRHLWTQLRTPARETFPENRLRVITYNYDRSLERFLQVSLKHAYEPSARQILGALVQAIPIVHVHGTLNGSMPEDAGYAPEVNAALVKESAKTIKVIHEGVDTDPELEQAHELLSKSDVICFLGFGYNPTNLKRLRLGDLDPSARIFGSAYGFYDGQRTAVQNYFGRFDQGITWGSSESGILSFLHQTPVLL